MKEREKEKEWESERGLFLLLSYSTRVKSLSSACARAAFCPLSLFLSPSLSLWLLTSEEDSFSLSLSLHSIHKVARHMMQLTCTRKSCPLILVYFLCCIYFCLFLSLSHSSSFPHVTSPALFVFYSVTHKKSVRHKGRPAERTHFYRVWHLSPQSSQAGGCAIGHMDICTSSSTSPHPHGHPNPLGHQNIHRSGEIAKSQDSRSKRKHLPSDDSLSSGLCGYSVNKCPKFIVPFPNRHSLVSITSLEPNLLILLHLPLTQWQEGMKTQWPVHGYNWVTYTQDTNLMAHTQSLLTLLTCLLYSLLTLPLPVPLPVPSPLLAAW